MKVFIRKISTLFLRPFLNLIPKKIGFVILTFHNIPHDKMSWFEHTISFIAQNFELADPNDLFSYKSGKQCLRTKVLITFDDGFYSNRIVAEKVLEKYNTKAIFFVTEKFIGLDPEEAFIFASNQFYPGSIINNSANHDYKAMSLNDLRWLISNGHTVGAHTATHKAVSLIESKDEVLDEIIYSADRLVDKIERKINTFAFPYGVPELINDYSLKVASTRFKYIFSNVRGNLCDSPGLKFIFRQNISPGDPVWLIKLIIEGRLDWKHKGVRKLSFEFLSRYETTSGCNIKSR